MYIVAIFVNEIWTYKRFRALSPPTCVQKMSAPSSTLARGLRSAAGQPSSKHKGKARAPIAGILVAIAGSSLYVAHESRRLRLEESPFELEKAPTDWRQRSQLREKVASSFFWGLNRFNVVSPQTTSSDKPKSNVENVKKPRHLPLLDGMVLRDLQLHEQYAGTSFAFSCL